MPSQVYTRRVVGHLWNTTDVQSLARVPVGETWILRDLVLANITSAEVLFDCFLITATGSLHLFAGGVPANSTTRLEYRQATTEGEELQVFTSTAGLFTLLLTAYVFSLP